MRVYIKSIVYHLPENMITNPDIVNDFPEWSVEKIAAKVGINKRHVASENETAADLAYHAAKKLFAQDESTRDSIDFLLFCTQSPDYKLPASACILQSRLKLRNNSGAIDINQGCSGYVYGLALAKGLIRAQIAKNVLLLTAETYSKYIHEKDKGNRTIFGDAATATIISTSGIAEIGHFSLGTDGSGAENLIVKTQGSRYPSQLKNIYFDDSDNPICSDSLFMNGGEIFSFTLAKVPQLIVDTLKSNDLKQQDIDLYVYHQANRHMLDFLRKKSKIEKERFYYCLSEFGNTVSNTIPISLAEAINDGSITNSSKILIAGFGVGYSWGGTVLHFS